MGVGGLFPGGEGPEGGGGCFFGDLGGGGLGKVDVFALAGGMDGDEVGFVDGVGFAVDPDWDDGGAGRGLEERHRGV